MPKIKAIRYHDISCGHRVVGHEGKCRHLHGHNYRVHFHCETEQLDSVGRVVDFSVIKSILCEWLEVNWDHKFLVWNKDQAINKIIREFSFDYLDARLLSPNKNPIEAQVGELLDGSFVSVPFNPTAENMAHYLLTSIAPEIMVSTNVVVTKIIIEETRKCSVEVEL
jgi:6-pyruvoyltetrahydropterin/6-carboxytetrahydropterin synthase